MDEEAINVSLQNASPLEAKATPDSPGGSGNPVFEDPGYTKLYNWFGITGEPDKDTQRQMQKIYEFAKNEVGSDDWAKILWEIRNLETRLGAPRVGEKRYTKLFGYVLTRIQESQVKKELAAYEGLPM